MKCFTYNSGKLTQGVVVQNEFKKSKVLKTCAILTIVPKVWNAEDLIDCIRSKDYADIFLHACVQLVEGDSISSVFPEDCFLVKFHCPLSFTNYKNTALELDVTPDGVLVVLFADSCVYDKDTKTYITNSSGKPVTSNNPPEESSEQLDNKYNYIEF